MLEAPARTRTYQGRPRLGAARDRLSSGSLRPHREIDMLRWSPKSLIALAIVPIALLAAACGSSGTTSSSSRGGAGPTADSAASAKVPSAVRSKGSITVAADATYAPDEFIGADGTTVEGMDADLAKAI